MLIQEPLPTLTLAETPEEQQLDFHPKTFEDYLGQEELKKKLALYTTAARMRNEPLDHLLLFGPPGLGKTTLARIMAQVMQSGIKLCSGPTLQRTGDLVAILSSLEPRDILFIDEIHRMPTAVEEMLYSAMEQFRIDVIIGQGPGAKSINLPMYPFTLVGATTKAGSISAPLRSRFGIVERLDFYTIEDLVKIVLQNAHFLNVEMSHVAAAHIARAARGTPRIAKKLLRRVRDFAQVNHHNNASDNLVKQALTFLGIDEEGLSFVDHKILTTLLHKFAGGPAGLETIASIIGEESTTLEDVYEPFLLRLGYLEKTPRGRQVPVAIRNHLAHKFGGQSPIF
jgi:holliday junction DNA helicase RuvB